MISQDYNHYFPSIHSNRKSLRTELSRGKLKKATTNKNMQMNPNFQVQHAQNYDLDKLCQKYSHQQNNFKEQRKESDRIKKHKSSEPFRNSTSLSINCKNNRLLSQNVLNQNYISKMSKYRHYNENVKRTVPIHQQIFQNKMKLSAEKLKIRSADSFNRQKSQSLLMKKYKNKNIKQNLFDKKNIDQNTWKLVNQNASIKQKESDKQILINNQFDEYEMRNTTSKFRRAKKSKKNHHLSSVSPNPYQQSEQSWDFNASSFLLASSHNRKSGTDIPQNDYEKIKLLQKQYNIQRIIMQSESQDNFQLQESNRSQDSQISKLLGIHNQQAYKNILNQSQISNSMLNLQTNSKNNSQINPYFNKELYNQYQFDQQTLKISKSKQQKKDKSYKSKDSPFLQIRGQLKPYSQQSKATKSALSNRNLQYSNSLEEAQNKKQSQIMKIPQLRPNKQFYSKDTPIIQSECVWINKFNLIDSIRLWSSYQQNKLENLNANMPLQIYILKTEQQSIYQRIGTHLSKVNLMADFVKMKEQMYQGEVSMIYDIPSFLIYKRFYQQRIKMVQSLTGSAQNCFQLTENEITNKQLEEIKNKDFLIKWIESIQQCNKLIYESLKEYFQKIQQQTNQKLQFQDQTLHIIKPKQTGYLMTLLNQQLQNLVIKRDEMFKDQTVSQFKYVSSKIVYEPSIGKDLIQREIYQSDQYEALSLRIFSIMEIVFLLSQLSQRRVKKCLTDFDEENFENYFKEYYETFKQTILFFN